MISRRQHPFRPLSAVSACLVLFLLCCAAPGSAAVVSDDFNDNVRNEGLWAFASAGVGPTMEEREQRLEVTVPAASSGEHFFVAAETRSRFRGDLDVQVDFDLLEYPSRNGVRMGIVIHRAGQAFGSVQRTSLSERESFDEPREAYILDTGGPLGRHPSGEVTGKLRLTRVGSLVTGYYWDAAAAEWVPFASGPSADEDVHFGLSVWSHDRAFEDQDVRVAFDNFIVNKGKVVGPSLPDLHGRWLQLRQRSRGNGQGQQSRVRGVFAVRNTGGATAGPSIVRFFLSEDESLSPDDLLLQQKTVRILRRHRRQLVELRSALPPGVAARGRFIIAVVDASNSVWEANEFGHAIARGPLR